MLRVAPFARRSSSTAWTSLGTTQATRHSQRRCCATNHHHSAATTLINGSSRHTTSLSHPDVDQVLQYDSMSAAQLRVALAAKDAIIHQLQQRVVALEKQTQHQKQPHVNGVNQPGPSTPPAVEANGHHSHGSLCCEATVSSEEELQHALSHGKLTIRIAAGATVTLTDAVYVEGELSLTGDPGATIVGQLRIKGASASLAATNVHFISPRADDSCIHVSQHGHLALVNCTVSDARDGIYLCGQAVATLDRTRIANCARGLFESHRCRAELLNAEFIDNLFHAVLLSHTDADAVKQLARAGNKFSGGRADVALGYNPMTDTYSQLYHAHSGAEIVLPADEATTNLVDPTW